MVEVVFCEITKSNLKRAKRNPAKSGGELQKNTADRIAVINLHLEQGTISDNGLENERLKFLKQKKDYYLFGCKRV